MGLKDLVFLKIEFVNGFETDFGTDSENYFEIDFETGFGTGFENDFETDFEADVEAETEAESEVEPLVFSYLLLTFARTTFLVYCCYLDIYYPLNSNCPYY